MLSKETCCVSEKECVGHCASHDCILQRCDDIWGVCVLRGVGETGMERRLCEQGGCSAGGSC